MELTVSFAFLRGQWDSLWYCSMLSPVVGKWIGAIGVFAGVITIAAGVEVAYVGFASSMVGLSANSMIVYSIWIGILGAFMWRKTMHRNHIINSL